MNVVLRHNMRIPAIALILAFIASISPLMVIAPKPVLGAEPMLEQFGIGEPPPPPEGVHKTVSKTARRAASSVLPISFDRIFEEMLPDSFIEVSAQKIAPADVDALYISFEQTPEILSENIEMGKKSMPMLPEPVEGIPQPKNLPPSYTTSIVKHSPGIKPPPVVDLGEGYVPVPTPPTIELEEEADAWVSGAVHHADGIYGGSFSHSCCSRASYVPPPVELSNNELREKAVVNNLRHRPETSATYRRYSGMVPELPPAVDLRQPEEDVWAVYDNDSVSGELEMTAAVKAAEMAVCNDQGIANENLPEFPQSLSGTVSETAANTVNEPASSHVKTAVGTAMDHTVAASVPAVATVAATSPQPKPAVNTGGTSFIVPERVPVLIILIVFCACIWHAVSKARRGEALFIRKISGLSALEDAVGRATEMGRGVLYIPGIADMDDIQTIAGVTIMGHVAETAAEYETPFYNPMARSFVMSVAQEVVKQAYLEKGKMDAYRPDRITYLTDDQFGFVSGVAGLMTREKPAACFYFGTFYAESLILAETGNSVGAIQVSGTAEASQIPFFVAACDYTLIGEELYAASAYFSKNPREIGTLKGQDLMKVLIIFSIIFATIVVTLKEGQFIASPGFVNFAERFMHYLK